MNRFIPSISLLFLFILGQSDSVSVSKFPEEGIEYKLNTLSGLITDSITGQPIEEVYINLYTGNKVLKHTLLSDENGYFSKDNIGYLWKPKVHLSIDNYKDKSFRLDPALLDSNNNIRINSEIVPIPLNERVQNLERSTLTKRAETFFIIGNVFYNYLSKDYVEKIIIASAEAIELQQKNIVMRVNNKMYDVSKCYVPQNGRYENLSYILHSLLKDPIFEKSKLPIYLSESLLDPSVIFGSVIDLKTNRPITGAEIILTESVINYSDHQPVSNQIFSMANYNNRKKQSSTINKKQKYDTYKRRVSDQNGQFAFTIDNPGSYELDIRPPAGYKQKRIGKPNIIVQYGKGGWYQSNFYLEP